MGHAGTLDPLATGLLIILLNDATRRAQEFSGGKKEYEFTMQLGVETDTYDCQGKVVAKKPVPQDWRERLEKILPEFIGEITQVTPPFSAVKHNGVPLYKLARMGKEVPLKPRRVCIESLEIIPLLCPPEADQPLADKEGGGGGRTTPPSPPLISQRLIRLWRTKGRVDLHVLCSSGTYVRAIAHDLGKRLGCGASVTALRRIYSEPFHVREARSLEDLKNISNLS